MESVGSILAEVSVSETMVLFEEDTLRHLSVEELYDDLELWLEDIQLVKEVEPDLLAKEKQLKNEDKIVVYFCELYRRNMMTGSWYKYDHILCSRCNKEITEEYWPIVVEGSDHGGTKTQNIVCSVCQTKNIIEQNKRNTPGNQVLTPIRPDAKTENSLRQKLRLDQTWKILYSYKKIVSGKRTELKAIQKKMAMLVKKPAPQNLAEEINELMDSILDKNGNKISRFKEYLTPEHYRLIRSACDVSEWSRDEQTELLSCLKKMNKIENI